MDGKNFFSKASRKWTNNYQKAISDPDFLQQNKIIIQSSNNSIVNANTQSINNDEFLKKKVFNEKEKEPIESSVVRLFMTFMEFPNFETF